MQFNKRRTLFISAMALVMTSSVALASDYENDNPIVVLNSIQLDSITAGAIAEADAIAIGEGLIPSTGTHVIVIADESMEGSVAVAGGVAGAVGFATDAEVHVATVTNGTISNTFNISGQQTGNIVSIAGGLEISYGFSFP